MEGRRCGERREKKPSLPSLSGSPGAGLVVAEADLPALPSLPGSPGAGLVVAEADLPACTNPPESPVVAALAPAQLSAGVAVASALAEALFAAVSCRPPPAA